MPTVPRKIGQEVMPGGVPSVPSGTVPSLPTFGGGQQINRQTALAKETIRIAGKVSDENKRRLQEARDTAKLEMDKTLTMDADLQSAALQNDIHLEFSALKGRNAVESMDLLNKKWSDGIKDINSTLTNQDQRDAFTVASSKRYLTLSKAAGVHTDAELTKYDQEVIKSTLIVSREDAAANYTDLEFVGDQFVKQRAVIFDTAAKYGRGDAWAEAEWVKARSRTHADIIKRMVMDEQLPLAEAYLDDVESELTTVDRRSIFTLRKEKDRFIAERNTRFYGEVYELAVEMKVSFEDLDSMLSDGRLTPPQHARLTRQIANPYDSKRFSEDDKSEKFFELTMMYADLKGGTIDGDGNILTPVSGNDLDGITAFREAVGEAQEFLTRPESKAFLKNTQINFNEAREAKVGVWKEYVATLRSMSLSGSDMHSSLARGFLDIFNAATGVTEARVSATKTIRAQAMKSDSVDSMHEVGDIKQIGGESWIVEKIRGDGKAEWMPHGEWSK